MIQKTVLAISGVFLLLSLGTSNLKASSTLGSKPATCSGGSGSCCTTYDVTWYDSCNAVISTTTTTDLATTVASPPTGASDYMWVDESNTSTQNYVTLETTSTTPWDLSDATTDTDPSQAVDVIYNCW